MISLNQVKMNKSDIVYLTQHAFLVTPDKIQPTTVWAVVVNGVKNMSYCLQDQLCRSAEVCPISDYRGETQKRNITVWWSLKGMDRNSLVENLAKQTGRGNAIIFSEQGLDSWDLAYYQSLIRKFVRSS